MNTFKPETGAHMDIRRRTNTYKREAMKAASELGYGPVVVAEIMNAKTERQITSIMIRARKRKFG